MTLTAQPLSDVFPIDNYTFQAGDYLYYFDRIPLELTQLKDEINISKIFVIEQINSENIIALSLTGESMGLTYSSDFIKNCWLLKIPSNIKNLIQNA